jgi:molybdopterin/thiamine biosynthesis adenylyltransferase
MNSIRFDRQEAFFGKEGQEKLAASRVAVVGVGGLGTHVVQQLALLGVGALLLVDGQDLDETNRNRYIGARHDDPIPGTPKVDIGERIAHDLDPAIVIDKVYNTLISDEAFDAIQRTDYVFGCIDKEGVRLVLNEFCAAYSKPYFDLATEILPGNPSNFGGRVCIAWDGHGCLNCYEELDGQEAREDLEGPTKQRGDLYGIDRISLEVAGPSVVTINGVVASLALTEFMAGVTGLRPPKGLMTYRGDLGKVTLPFPDGELPTKDCHYCQLVRGKGDAADVRRYIRAGIGSCLP